MGLVRALLGANGCSPLRNIGFSSSGILLLF
jgi:hypothetical protein